MAAILAAARPLVDMVWVRETESGVFDTPERRAALESRLREITRAIGEESVRRHYGQAFAERVAAFFPVPERVDRRFTRGRGVSDRYARDARQGSAHAPIAVSDRLRRSTILAGRATHPLRETVLLMTMVNHPALLGERLDEFANVEFSHPDLDQLRDAVVEIVAHEHDLDGAALRAKLGEGRFATLLARLAGQIEAIGHWPAMPAAADRDAEEGWLQALTLHRRKRTLNKELKDAEAALASDPSEANLARMVDIQAQLAKSEGTEALIEGFGLSSGRQARVF
jgi:DNA primase